MKSFLVVVSHYNAWPTCQLLSLLDQVKSIPAGRSFRCRVVVNRAIDADLELPERHQDVEILYRENTGYNIGAWDHGWRQAPDYDRYLFLQEECQILRPGWLEAISRRLDDPRVGLVGECMAWPGFSWKRADAYNQPHPFPDRLPNGSKVIIPVGVRAFLEAREIPIGRSAEHLQSLVWAARREVLEQIDGFIVGRTYGEAIGSEVAVSKKVAALGLRVREVGMGPFRYILHPQWRNFSATPLRVAFSRLEPWIPIPMALGMKQFFRDLKARLTGNNGEWKPPAVSEGTVLETDEIGH